ncbi:hypothetical protein [Kouleothrix sp.]|uniref:hypothetical protein n=1 Tax=Kouleothrix sp. TaxID=2779161 RepID=UPI003918C654
MPSSKRTRNNGKTNAKQQLPQPADHIMDMGVQQDYTATNIQQVGIDPSTLTPRDVIHLQRTIGNRAVNQILSGSLPRLDQHPSQSNLPRMVQREQIKLDNGKKIETKELTRADLIQLRLANPKAAYKITSALNRYDYKRSLGDLLLNQAIGGNIDKYLAGKDRARLAQVNKELSQAYKAIVVHLKVTPEVLEKIGKNLQAGEPPMRPELGMAGLTWTTARGNPYPGIGSEKTEDVNLSVYKRYPEGIRIISSRDLEKIFETARTSITLETILHDAQQEARSNWEKATLDNLSTPEKKRYDSLKRNGTSHEEALQTISDNRRDNAQRAAGKMNVETMPGKWKDQTEEKEGGRVAKPSDAYIEKKMWFMVADRVKATPEHAAFVDFQNSRFSKYPNKKYRGIEYKGFYRNGRFLLVADRDAMLLRLDAIPLALAPTPELAANSEPKQKVTLPPSQGILEAALKLLLLNRIRSELDGGKAPNKIEEDLKKDAIPQEVAIALICQVLEERGQREA